MKKYFEYTDAVSNKFWEISLKGKHVLIRPYMPMYYFNQQTEICEMFIWGGCAGLVPFENWIVHSRLRPLFLSMADRNNSAMEFYFLSRKNRKNVV